MKIFIFFNEPYRYMAISEKDGVMEQGYASSLSESVQLKLAREIIGVIPGELVNIKKLELPIKQKNKLLQALPFALENDLLGEIEDQHLNLIEWGADKPAYVSICQKATIEKYLDWALENKLVLSSLIPDFALYETSEDVPFYFFQRDQNASIIIENQYMRSVCDNNLLPAMLKSFAVQDEEFEVQKVSVDTEKLHSALKAIPGFDIEINKSADKDQIERLKAFKGKSSYELLTDRYKPDDGGLKKHTLAIAAAIFVLSILTKVGFDHWMAYKLEGEMVALKDEAQTAIQDVFPGLRRFSSLGTANHQLEQEMLKLQGSQAVDNEFLQLLAIVNATTNKTKSKLEQLNYRNNTLVFSIVVKQFANLEAVGNALSEGEGVAFKLISSGAKGSEVQARYEIKYQ